MRNSPLPQQLTYPGPYFQETMRHKITMLQKLFNEQNFSATLIQLPAQRV
jgi:hypothetical protein